jgi:3-oxoacyl-[acyl-carrier protein] reductase
VAIVTGASGAIGKGIADALWERGARTCYLDVQDPPDREAIAARPGAICVRCDVSDELQVEGAVRQAARSLDGRPTILVNNAGVSHRAPLEDTTGRTWDRVIAVNLTGAFLMTRQVVPSMRAARRGRLVHVSSIVARTGGSSAGLAAYAAAKAGLHGFSRALAVECATSRVTSNVIAPAWIDAGMFAAREVGVGKPPVGRFGTIRDVVEAVLYLAGPGSSFVTGQVLEVNGGLHFG